MWLLAIGLAAVMIPTLRHAGWSLTALPRVDSPRRNSAAAARASGSWDFARCTRAPTTVSSTGGSRLTRSRPVRCTSVVRQGLVPVRAPALRLARLAVQRRLGARSARSARGGWARVDVRRGGGRRNARVGPRRVRLGRTVRRPQRRAHQCGRARLGGATRCRAAARGVGVTGWRPALAHLDLPRAPAAGQEPLLVVSVAVVVWELGQHRVRRAALYATTAIPALLWWTYIRVHLGAWFTSGDSALGLPLAGWWRTLFGADVRHEHARSRRGRDSRLDDHRVALAAVRAIRRRGPVDLVYLALAAIAACLAPNATLAFTTALRNTAFLIVLIPFVIAAPQLPGTVRRPWPSHL